MTVAVVVVTISAGVETILGRETAQDGDPRRAAKSRKGLGQELRGQHVPALLIFK
jgi:hypothetical protein